MRTKTSEKRIVEHRIELDKDDILSLLRGELKGLNGLTPPRDADVEIDGGEVVVAWKTEEFL